MTEHNDIWTIIISIVTFITGGGALKLLQLLVGAWERSRRDRMPSVLDAVLEVYSTLHTLQRAVGAGRIIVARASNGGSKPHPSKPLYISILYEVTSTIDLAQPTWGEKRLADEAYIKLLDEMLAQGIVELTTERMLPGILHDQNIHDGVKAAKLVNIGPTDDGNLLYLIICWDRDRKMDEASVSRRRAVINASVARIQRLMAQVPV